MKNSILHTHQSNDFSVLIKPATFQLTEKNIKELVTLLLPILQGSPDNAEAHLKSLSLQHRQTVEYLYRSYDSTHDNKSKYHPLFTSPLINSDPKKDLQLRTLLIKCSRSFFSDITFIFTFNDFICSQFRAYQNAQAIPELLQQLAEQPNGPIITPSEQQACIHQLLCYYFSDLAPYPTLLRNFIDLEAKALSPLLQVFSQPLISELIATDTQWLHYLKEMTETARFQMSTNLLRILGPFLSMSSQPIDLVTTTNHITLVQQTPFILYINLHYLSEENKLKLASTYAPTLAYLLTNYTSYKPNMVLTNVLDQLCALALILQAHAPMPELPNYHRALLAKDKLISTAKKYVE